MGEPSMSAGSSAAILAIKLGALGDVLLALGALADLRAAHREALAVLTRPAYRPLLERCPWVDAVIPDPALPRWRIDGWWRLARRLRGWRFVRVYDLQNSRRSASYRRFLLRGIPASALPPDTPLPPDGRPARSLPVPERLALQLERAGIAPRQVLAPSLEWMCAPVDALLASAGVTRPYLVLLPGSSRRHLGKRWPHFQSLAALLVKRGLKVITIPGPEESDIGDDWPGVVLRASGRALDLFELAGVLAGAWAVVGNDSGPTHLAALLGRPGIALFGPTSPEPALTGIDRHRLRVLQSRALADLSPQSVLESLFAQLGAR